MRDVGLKFINANAAWNGHEGVTTRSEEWTVSGDRPVKGIGPLKGWGTGSSSESSLLLPAFESTLPTTSSSTLSENPQHLDRSPVVSSSSSHVPSLKTDRAADKDVVPIPPNMLHLSMSVSGATLILPSLRRLLNAEPAGKRVLAFLKDQDAVDWAYKEYFVQRFPNVAQTIVRLSGRVSKMERSKLLQKIFLAATDPNYQLERSTTKSSMFFGGTRSGPCCSPLLILATDLAARGLDLPMLTHVVNLDPPPSGHHYLHRAGRVARAGNPGVVVSICDSARLFAMKRATREAGLPPLTPIKIYNGQLWRCRNDLPVGGTGARRRWRLVEKVKKEKRQGEEEKEKAAKWRKKSARVLKRERGPFVCPNEVLVGWITTACALRPPS